MKSIKGLLITTVNILILSTIGFGTITSRAENKKNNYLDMPIVDPIDPSIEVIPTDKEPNKIPYQIKRKPDVTKKEKSHPNNKKETSSSDVNNSRKRHKDVFISKNNEKLFLTNDFFNKQLILEKKRLFDDNYGGNDDEHNTYYGELAAGLSGVVIYGTPDFKKETVL